MSFRRLRSDTLVRTLERQYSIELNARGDMKLGNLLRTRGFSSWSHLLQAYRGQSAAHARKRRVFLGFHRDDLRQVAGFRLMIQNPRLDLSMYDQGVRRPIDSERGVYVRSVIKPMISRSEVVACLIGNGTAWREWVNWEIRTAKNLHKGICGIRLKGARGHGSARRPRYCRSRWQVRSGCHACRETAHP